MSLYLTQVKLTSIPKRSRFWLRFGHPVNEVSRHRLQRLVYFEPQATFCTVRWHGNPFGTILWQLSIMRAVASWEGASTIMDVDPGAEVLLRVSSKMNIRRILDLIKRIESRGIDPAAVSTAYWRTVQNRIMSRELIPDYGVRQHIAHLNFQRMLG